jgi:hypothetical protein
LGVEVDYARLEGQHLAQQLLTAKSQLNVGKAVKKDVKNKG